MNIFHVFSDVIFKKRNLFANIQIYVAIIQLKLFREHNMQYISNATGKTARENFQSESECCFHRKDGDFILKDDSENYFRYTYTRRKRKRSKYKTRNALTNVGFLIFF